MQVDLLESHAHILPGTGLERAQLAKDARAIFNLHADEQDESKHRHTDFGVKRMKRDQEDVMKLLSLFKTFNPCAQASSDLVSFTTGDVANDTVKHDLLTAEETGKAVTHDFVNERLRNKTVNFYDRIKTKNLCTFPTMYTVQVNVGKQMTVSLKADRDLFRRVITAMEAGREVDLDKLLEQELCPVPLSLATADGSLRLPRN